MDRAELRKNLETHIEAERRNDLDAIMASLSDMPRYVIQDKILEGSDALRKMYARAIELNGLTAENMDEYLRALDDTAITRWGDDHCIIEYSDDYPCHRNMIVVVHFDDTGKVKSENTYCRGPNRLSILTEKVG